MWSGVDAPPTGRGGRWEVLFHVVEEGSGRSCSMWSGVDAPPTSRGERREVPFHVVRRGCTSHWSRRAVGGPVPSGQAWRHLPLDLTRFNKIAIQGTPQMAVD